THLGKNVGPIQIDPSHLEQVLLNLIMNARDAIPKGGSITIETRKAPGAVVALSVSDTGIGIEPETMNHLFEPFFTTKGKGQGTGLGLATVYGIVQQNHGEIAVESHIGRGTTFRILFPELQSETASSPATAADVSAAHDSGGSET